ncbi:MAG TPA: lytic transglycosylase domain-containing protein [Ectothiorhodospiraceae bacterium]|nr:lytic transglycosylase domain-containing protein [Ectothiorhodospiraceae bacterium]
MHRGWAIFLLPLLWGYGSVAVLAEELNIDSDSWTSQYDPIFKKYTKRYFGPFYDWRWFKSQAIAESRLNPNVTSNRGAKGLMQLLPSTFAEIRELNPHFTEIDTPRWNIAAGIYYDRYLYRKWDVPSEKERLFYAFASYNAGYSRLLRTIKRYDLKASSWNAVRKRLPGETRHYVKTIRELMNDKRHEKRRLRGISKLLLSQNS